MLQTIFMILFVFAVILLAVTLLLAIRSVKKNRTGKECSGTIIRFETTDVSRIGGDYESKAISPVVAYEVNGKQYELLGRYYATNMKVGQEISILYREDDPSDASIKTGTILAPVITGSVAIILLIPPLVYMILKNRGLA